MKNRVCLNYFVNDCRKEIIVSIVKDSFSFFKNFLKNAIKLLVLNQSTMTEYKGNSISLSLS